MVCRDEKRGKEAQEEIIKESNNPNVELCLCDMSLPQEVFSFTKRFVETKKPLSVRINVKKRNETNVFFFCYCLSFIDSL